MSVGHELLINPSVILLDEPTSGETGSLGYQKTSVHRADAVLPELPVWDTRT